MTRIDFYALRNDLLRVLDYVEASHSIRYIDLSDYKKPTPGEWTRGRDIPGLGSAKCETGRSGDRFLIVQTGTQIRQSRSVQNDGTKRYDIHQVNNAESVILSPGGAWRNNIVLAGEFATMSTTPFSKVLMRAASSGIRKSFEKINGYWVGPEALDRFIAGARLTIAEQSPPEFDLKKSHEASQTRDDLPGPHKSSAAAPSDLKVTSMKDFQKSLKQYGRSAKGSPNSD